MEELKGPFHGFFVFTKFSIKSDDFTGGNEL